MEVLVGFSPFLLYFAAHSYVWWKGSGNSVGEIRVMAAVFPSAVLLAMLAWSSLFRWLPLTKRIQFWMTISLSVLLVLAAFKIHKMPVGLAPTQLLIKHAAGWMKETECLKSKIYYYDPYWWYFLDMNPYESEKMRERVPDPGQPEKNIKPGEIVLWDAHFSPNEGQLPLEKLAENPHFELVRLFRPDEPFQVLGGYDYEIYVFRRTELAQY
jgi:hypothetical protein